MKAKVSKCQWLQYVTLGVVVLVGVYVRFLGKDFISGDFEDCLYEWYQEIVAAGPEITALKACTGDYAIPYVFLIWLLAKIPVPFLYSLKLLNGIFDFVLAVLGGKIVRHFIPQRENASLVGFSVIWLLPNVFMNSCYWGQCDGMYSMFLLAAVLCMLKDKYSAMMFFYGLAFSFKLQAVFLLPFILIFYWTVKKFSMLQFLIVPATMLVMNIPAFLAGYTPGIIWVKYAGQAGGYPWLYYFYPNLWYFFQAGPYYLFNAGAMMLAVTALLVFVVLLVNKGVAVTPRNMLPVMLWTVYTCVFFLPSMHERYGFLAELIAVIMAIVYTRTAWIAAGLILSTLPKYLYALGLMGNPPGLQMATAIVNTAVYLTFTCILWKHLFTGDAKSIYGEKRGEADA